MTGQISTLLGGLSSAGLGLSLEYADLNQPQTITAPTSVQPYSQFQSKLRAFEQGLAGSLSSATGAGSSAAGGTPSAPGASTTPTPSPTPTTPGASGSSSKIQAYSQCVQAAGGDISKMQQCAPLLNGSG